MILVKRFFMLFVCVASVGAGVLFLYYGEYLYGFCHLAWSFVAGQNCYLQREAEELSETIDIIIEDAHHNAKRNA